ncbi:MAG: phosphonate degradation HD-domain oxygenase [Rhodanobacter sp.]
MLNSKLQVIRELLDLHGHVMYTGEPVTQLEHALQTALLAETHGASSELIAAAFLHDLGHMLNFQGATPTQRGVDDAHQNVVKPFLQDVLPAAVLDPIRLHVDAKRCLCAIDPTYEDQLSDDSKRSLRLQGGIFNEEEVQHFLREPHAQDAMRLRRWDDLAKEAGLSTPSADHYLGIIAGLA